MKQKFILWLSLLAVFNFMLQSCRNDHFPEKETFNNSSAFQLSSKRISLNQSKHKTVLLPELKEMETELMKNSSSGKSVNIGNGLTINTDDVIYIENGPNYYTYTFRIERENAPENVPLENLLLSPLPDGTFKEFLVTYNLTSQEKQELMAGHSINVDNKTTITEIKTGTNWGAQLNKSTETWCYYDTYSEFKPCPCEGHTTLEGCECSIKATNYTYITQICELYEWDDTINPLDPGGTGGGGGGTGETGGGNTNPPCDPTAPTNPQPGMTDENGCPIGIPTLPNLGLTKNPCEKIKNWFEDPKFKEKYDSITKPGIHSLDREKGYYMRYPPVGTNTLPAYVEVHMAPCSTDGDLPSFTEGMGGLMHTHNDENCNGNIPIKAPSPIDIRTFLNTLMPESGQYAGGYHNAYSLVSTSAGNYMLMYNGTNYPGSMSHDTVEKLTEDYEKTFQLFYNLNDTVSQADIERIFTKFMKEKINKPGLEVYRVTPTSKIKLEYDPTSPNSVKQTPCP